MPHRLTSSALIGLVSKLASLLVRKTREAYVAGIGNARDSATSAGPTDPCSPLRELFILWRCLMAPCMRHHHRQRHLVAIGKAVRISLMDLTVITRESSGCNIRISKRHPLLSRVVCIRTDRTSERADRREPVADRINRGWNFWESITSERDAVVRRWVRFGYSIEWSQGPCPPCNRPNQQSATQHAKFLDAYIADSIAAGAISAVAYRPHCVHPLGVIPKPRSTKLRPILNMRSANAYMAVPAFRFDSLSDFPSIADKSDVLISLDMVQGYYHVALHPDSRTFTGSRWRDTLYVYNVLPFGMANAPRCFAKIMGVLVRHWRAAGIRMLAYLDDWLFVLRPADVARVSARILTDCSKARIAINREKKPAGTGSRTHPPS